jgi:hypothetical protein
MEHWFEKLKIASRSDLVMDDYFRLHQEIEDGEFWYDKIKRLRSESIKRLKLAMENLPLPAAFNEAAKAIRALIRESKDEDKVCIEYLNQLYKLACIRSFMLDYAPILKMPGYNVMLSIPGGYLFKLKMDYIEIGLDKLDLLTKTDKKMIFEKWGEVKNHRTMNEMYKELWDRAEIEMANKEKKRFEEII